MIQAQTRPASRALYSSPTDGAAWVMRGANFVVTYAEETAGARLERDNPDEYFVYLPDGGATVSAGDASLVCTGATLVIMPPGKSEVAVVGENCRVLRIFSSAARDMIAAARNAATYADGAAEVATPRSWAPPRGGYSLRTYALADYADRRMRLFRSSNLMVNVFDFAGPRDVNALSPHSHVDFEQGSFGMSGAWVHSLRYPWGKQLADWREDEHLEIGSPSLLVIPATVIHTSRSTAAGPNQLVDMFCPPRTDFVEQGLVCNEDEYDEHGPAADA